jgi:hypothetical protein
MTIAIRRVPHRLGSIIGLHGAVHWPGAGGHTPLAPRLIFYGPLGARNGV